MIELENCLLLLCLNQKPSADHTEQSINNGTMMRLFSYLF